MIVTLVFILFLSIFKVWMLRNTTLPFSAEFSFYFIMTVLLFFHHKLIRQPKIKFKLFYYRKCIIYGSCFKINVAKKIYRMPDTISLLYIRNLNRNWQEGIILANIIVLIGANGIPQFKCLSLQCLRTQPFMWPYSQFLLFKIS